MMMTCRKSVCSMVGVLLLGALPLAAAEPTGWKAGAARVDTTPGEPVWMSGYASRKKPSEGIAHPLAAKALALADRDGTRIVMVTCDIISFSREFSARVGERI